MKNALVFCILLISTASALANDLKNSEHAKKSLEIYRTIIGIPTVAGKGNVPKMAAYLASEFKAVGFSNDDIQIIPSGETASLIVRYPTNGLSDKEPILLLGHMDVVEALAKDWQRPPFELTQDDKNFYGRGSIDNKFGIAMLSSTFIRLKKQGFVPNRELYLVFSGDEETGMVTTRMLANERPELATAEFALNSDAGGGDLDENGNAIAYLVQAAEKTYVSFELTLRNKGGHSSRPRTDNAIYELSSALLNIKDYHFPVMWSDMTRKFFKVSGHQFGGELGEAMIAFAKDPTDKQASDRLQIESSYVGTTRTTCVATMLNAGHAENALPQSATATVNCRVFPGVSVEKIKQTLQKVVDNDEIEIVTLDEPVESPISELREDVMSAIAKAVHLRYPNLDIIAYMESGGTDGKHFRKAGIPTWAISSAFINPDDMYAHGLNERLPIKAFYDGLDHWSIILKELAGN
ncbi:M20/M25/M40 family metallo-hydrolase [Aliiglaciecola lipolytica]|uniref:M20/M25/M40 family metallo-hydrolase n=1 Tax=Aliiglaciecola lipolytica TaxID=477689 RepID=UPI001C082E8C|nr:M20/M25/M40 family metallo-hydrolase [Aliiglaciecola lipolytica]MBU2879969.1 M20/M25/M40 family metallo-hydrolase [Aliiglaciecola lipolytica]